MADSTLTFQEGEPIEVGSHGQHDYVFEEGVEVVDAGESTLVFESGTGIGGANQPYGIGFEIGSGTGDVNVGEGFFDNVRIVGGDLVESFEDQDISYYQEIGQSGSTWTVESGPKTPQDGSYYLEGQGGDSTSNHRFVTYFDQQALDRYPQPGDTFRMAWNTGGNNPEEKQGPGFSYRVGKDDNGDPFYNSVSFTNTDSISPPEDQYRIINHSSPTDGVSVEHEDNLKLDTWYEIEVDWASDDSQATADIIEGGTVIESLTVSI